MPNLFDLLIVGLFGGTVLLSFLGGLGKVFSTLAGLYGGTLLGAWFYQSLASLVLAKFFPAMTDFTGNLTAFLLLIFLASLAISIGLGRNYALKRLAKRAGVFNNLSGGALGIVLAIFATILATMVTSLLLQVLNADGVARQQPDDVRVAGRVDQLDAGAALPQAGPGADRAVAAVHAARDPPAPQPGKLLAKYAGRIRMARAGVAYGAPVSPCSSPAPRCATI